MKNQTKAIAVVLALLFSQTTVFAATTVGTQGPFNITTTVSGAASFRATIYKNLPLNAGPDFPGGAKTSMAFGTLEEQTFTAVGQPTFKELRSSNVTGTGSFAVVFEVNTHQAVYTIQQNGTALTAAAITLPTGACTVTPVYSPLDNGTAPMPAGASLGAAGPWLGSKILYSSGASGASRVVQGVYGISGLDVPAGGTAAIPIDQPLGNYSGTITFTLVQA